MSQTTATPIWPVVHAERGALMEDLAYRPPEDFRTPSLCAGWDVHDVLAHLVESARTTRMGFVWHMIVAHGDFDRVNALGVAREKREDPRQTLGSFAALIDATSTAPAAPVTRLVEAFVHGEDIRRPLRIASHYPVDAVAEALAFQLRTSVAVGGGKQRAAGLRLIASDAGVEFGAGPSVQGSAVDLLLAVSGRPVPEGSLTGDGVAELLRRD